jgi:hypothetical protein
MTTFRWSRLNNSGRTQYWPKKQEEARKIIEHSQSVGYRLLSVYAVDAGITDDLIFTRNIDGG